MDYATECFFMSPNEPSVAMNMYLLALSTSLGAFVFPRERDVGVGWVFGMAVFFQVSVSIMVVLLAWKGQALRGTCSKGLLDTKDRERVECTEGKSNRQEVIERKAVESPGQFQHTRQGQLSGNLISAIQHIRTDIYECIHCTLIEIS